MITSSLVPSVLDLREYGGDLTLDLFLLINIGTVWRRKGVTVRLGKRG